MDLFLVLMGVGIKTSISLSVVLPIGTKKFILIPGGVVN